MQKSFPIYFSSDIIEDTGSSLSPEVDIGQIEGSFIYGVGLWTSEVISFHPETGKILQNDTWVRKQYDSLIQSSDSLNENNMIVCHSN